MGLCLTRAYTRAQGDSLREWCGHCGHMEYFLYLLRILGGAFFCVFSVVALALRSTPLYCLNVDKETTTQTADNGERTMTRYMIISLATGIWMTTVDTIEEATEMIDYHMNQGHAMKAVAMTAERG